MAGSFRRPRYQGSGPLSRPGLTYRAEPRLVAQAADTIGHYTRQSGQDPGPPYEWKSHLVERKGHQYKNGHGDQGPYVCGPLLSRPTPQRLAPLSGWRMLSDGPSERLIYDRSIRLQLQLDCEMYNLQHCELNQGPGKVHWR